MSEAQPAFTPFGDDIGAAWNAILRYRLSPEGLALPEDHAEKLTSFLELDVPPLTISQTAEYVFANRAELPSGLLVLGAKCAFYGAQKYIDGLGADGRGFAIADALRRESGEKAPSAAPWPAVKADPEPRPEFAPPEPAEAAAAPTGADAAA